MIDLRWITGPLAVEPSRLPQSRAYIDGMQACIADEITGAMTSNPFEYGTQDRQDFAFAYYTESRDCGEVAIALQVGRR